MSTIAPSRPLFLADSVRSRRIVTALMLLREALEGAEDLRRDAWEFALELRELCRAGVRVTDLRWLVGIGYVRHASERVHQGTKSRSFREANNLAFAGRVCFILTPEGLQFAHSLDPRSAGKGVEMVQTDSAPPSSPNGRPLWDAARRQLHFHGQLVKHFRVPAVNQETILAALEEEGWASRIDDPLPQSPNTDPKARLHDTIRSLNRNQARPLLRFRGDGTGTGVTWGPTVVPEGILSRPPQSAP